MVHTANVNYKNKAIIIYLVLFEYSLSTKESFVQQKVFADVNSSLWNQQRTFSEPLFQLKCIECKKYHHEIINSNGSNLQSPARFIKHDV